MEPGSSSQQRQHTCDQIQVRPGRHAQAQPVRQHNLQPRVPVGQGRIGQHTRERHRQESLTRSAAKLAPPELPPPRPQQGSADVIGRINDIPLSRLPDLLSWNWKNTRHASHTQAA
ncbi:hypothetical protein C3920_15460 [Novacetimonas pomaceti]|uniref:Transposase domain-containing protein n=1 Tax=Novacetimonas pomaceti TaxID=2021998 RepID=A0ABX5NY13_9PROT|nr:hypothetical protein C3920_15460 [Novacetimonas pomaceti]